MNQETTQATLPQNIGLALSGGGYRAAGFHLGLLSYLNRVDLLKQVKIISTVSGGTFIGAKYTLSLVAGQSFDEFYQEFYDFLKNTKLVELALDKLCRKECTVASGRTDLITAAAQVYAETFLQNPNDKPYRFGDILNAQIPLEEVIFNATEFRTGIAFRFQCSSNNNHFKGRIGNGNISIPKSDAIDIRIADIVAASSCFPGGFEPLAFPNDFNWSNEEILNNVREKVYKNHSQDIPLMDGGIYDNQGIESLYLADKRKKFLLDLFIFSDVDQQSDGNLYHFPPKLEISNFTLENVDQFSKTLLIFCILALIITVYKIIADFISSQLIWLDILLYIITILLTLGIIFILLWSRNIITNKILPNIPQVGRFAWDNLKKLTINQVANGIYLRLTSLQAMAGLVFMKRIRSMGFRFIYKEYKDHHEKLLSNLIYELQNSNSLAVLPGIQKPSPQLLNLINAAVNMPTTLWLTDDKQLDNLLISGQATICYKLMVYLTRQYGDDPNLYPTHIKNFWDTLAADWKHFCENCTLLK